MIPKMKKRFSAFTLIETLIAISVFCVGILTVLFWVSKTLRNQDYANVQIKSAFCSREWIEMLFNLRDANYHKELPRNCIFNRVKKLSENPYDEDDNPFCSWYLKPWTILKVSIDTEDGYITIDTDEAKTEKIQDFTWMFSDYQIYLHTWFILNWNTWFIYDHNPDDWEETWFARYLLITGVVDENKDMLDPNKLLKIESHVLYKRWELTWEKVMETFIWNYEF